MRVKIEENWTSTFTQELNTIWLMNSYNALVTSGIQLNEEGKKEAFHADAMSTINDFISKTGPFAHIPDEFYHAGDVSIESLTRNRKGSMDMTSLYRRVNNSKKRLMSITAEWVSFLTSKKIDITNLGSGNNLADIVNEFGTKLREYESFNFSDFI